MLPSPSFGGGHDEGRITYYMFKDIKKKYLRAKAKRTLRGQYEYLIEVNAILEEYLTEKLLQGGSAEFMSKGRADLANKQAELKTNTEFIDFLNRLT